MVSRSLLYQATPKVIIKLTRNISGSGGRLSASSQEARRNLPPGTQPAQGAGTGKESALSGLLSRGPRHVHGLTQPALPFEFSDYPEASGFGVQGWAVVVWGLGFVGKGLRFEFSVWGSECRVQG